MHLAIVLICAANSMVVALCNITITTEPTTTTEFTPHISESADTNAPVKSENDVTDLQYIIKKHLPTNESRHIALGTTGYKQLIRDSSVIVDKTLWIKKVLEHNSKYIVITCPRKWGKTINVQMLKTFLEYAVDSNGTIVVPVNRSFNYKLFNKGELMFVRGQKTQLDGVFRISKEKEVVQKYLGQYPVLYINFDITTGKNYLDLYNRLRYKISDACREHKYLEKVMADLNRNLTADVELRRWAQFNMDLFSRLLHGTERFEKAVKSSLNFLSGVLRQYYNKRIFVLIDNYDALLKLILHEKSISDVDANKFILVYRHLLDFGLNNDNIEKVVLTGTMYLCPEFLLSFNNLSAFDALNNEWYEYFGFHRAEVDALFKYANVAPELALYAHHRYQGYKLHKDAKVTLYNPWSIANFLHFREAVNFWEMTWDHEFLSNMLYIKPLKQIFETLLYGGNISVTFNTTQITKTEFFHLKQLIATTEHTFKLQNTSTDIILAYLCSLGYLTHAGESYDPARGIYLTHLRLPTGEVTNEFKKRFIWHYQFHNRIPGEEMLYFAQDLANFALDDNLTASDSLRNNTASLIADLPLFNSTLNNELVHSLIHYASLEIRSKSRCNTVLIRNTTTAAPDMIFYKENRGVIIKFEFDTSMPEKALDKIKQVQDVFQTFDEIKTVKLIGISISYYKNIDFIAEILNNG